MKQITKRMDMQVGLLLSIFVAIVAMTCSYVIYKVSYNDMRKSLNIRVERIYNYLEEEIDMSAFSNITSREDMDKEEYQTIHDTLSTTKECASVMHLYIATKNEDGQYIYAVDGLDPSSEDFHYPGNPIEEAIYLDVERAMSGKAVYPDEILHTSCGNIFVCYLPLIDDNGNTVGALGIEFEADHQYQTYQLLKQFVPIAILIFTILSFFISKLLFHRISNITLKNLANIDPLTGLKNRNAYQQDIDSRTAADQLQGMGVAVLDLNGLKLINKKFGHETGDRYIALMGEAYERLEVKHGIMYRFGSDEFVTVIENCTMEMLKASMLALTEEFEKIRFDNSLSFSYGCAVYDPKIDTIFPDTYRRADSEMYLYKKKYYEKNSENTNIDIKHHLIQKAVINALAHGYTAYQVVDWKTDRFLDYAVYDESARSYIEDGILTSTYSASIQKNYNALLDPNEKEEIMKKLRPDFIRSELRKHKEYKVRVHIPYKNRDQYVEHSFYTIKEENVGESFVVAIQNITEEVEKEEKQKKMLKDALREAEISNKAKSTFLFNMSHDIRTPMNAIIGFTEIAKKHIGEQERVMDYLKKVENSGKHLLRLINDVLDMARIESGKLEVDPMPCNLKDDILETKEMFCPEMEEKGLDFSVEIIDMENEYVFADILRIRQIEINLISNALKYTKTGGSVLYQVIQTGRDEDGYAHYEMHVKDTGIGMSEEFLKNIFGVFERERTATESGVQGTGLGLAITKQLVELHGGTIEVHSKQGVGTEFIVFLKFKIASKEMHVSKEVQEYKMSSFEGKRVLVVEDNELNREIAWEILSEFGFEIETAEDGIQAVEMVSSVAAGYYDVILMDIQMPYVDGYQTTAEIRKLPDPKRANVPIIAMTANAFEEDKEKAKMYGMDGHVSKPIDVKVLMNTLQEVGI
jgi:diguanylate cyclase (GGDEF)-like protein